MFHLIDRVYVDTKINLDSEVERMTIGKEIGYEYVPLIDNETPAKQYLWATSLDEIDPKEFDAALREAISFGDKVVIYCDSDTYTRLYALYVKALLPKVSKEDFDYIFLCKKAMYHANMSSRGEPSVDVLNAVQINGKVTADLYTREEKLQEVFDTLVTDFREDLSMEWQLVRMLVNGHIGKIPKVTKNILRRIAISNAHDALEVWGRHVARPENWEMAGADIDTLLNGETVFEGCLKLPHLSAPTLMRPGYYDHRPGDAWIKDMLSEAILIMEHLEDESSAKRATKILELLNDDRDMSQLENIMDRIQIMFDGPMRIALAMRDNGKYDESLIRFLLRMDIDHLKSMVDGADWL